MNFRIVAIVGVIVFGLASLACGAIAFSAELFGVDPNLYLAVSVLCAGALASSSLMLRGEGPAPIRGRAHS